MDGWGGEDSQTLTKEKHTASITSCGQSRKKKKKTGVSLEKGLEKILVGNAEPVAGVDTMSANEV